MDGSDQNGSISQHLEGFLSSARKLEAALGEEKKRSQKIAQEYLATRTTLENAVRELQNRVLQRQNKIQALNQAYQTVRADETRLRTELRELAEREKKTSAELAQYRTAWHEVLAREARARDSLLEHERARNALNELRNQIQALEANLARTQENAAALVAEKDRLRKETAETEAKRYQDVERARARLLAVTEENLAMKRAIELQTALTDASNERAERAEKALLALNAEIAMHRMESTNARMKIETVRKEANKTMLVEALRHDEETRDLRAKIEQLVERGVYAETADDVPEGVRVYASTLVAPSSSDRTRTVEAFPPASPEAGLV